MHLPYTYLYIPCSFLGKGVSKQARNRTRMAPDERTILLAIQPRVISRIESVYVTFLPKAGKMETGLHADNSAVGIPTLPFLRVGDGERGQGTGIHDSRRPRISTRRPKALRFHKARPAKAAPFFTVCYTCGSLEWRSDAPACIRCKGVNRCYPEGDALFFTRSYRFV